MAGFLKQGNADPPDKLKTEVNISPGCKSTFFSKQQAVSPKEEAACFQLVQSAFHFCGNPLKRKRSLKEKNRRKIF